MFLAPGAPAPKTGKVYDIKGTKWVQEPMEFFVFTKALDLLRGRFDDFFAGRQTAGDLLETLVNGKEVRQVIALVLRPHNPTPREWIQNRIRMKLAGIDPKNPLDHMTLQQAAEVVLDFFDLNISWIAAWIDALMKSFTSADPAASPTGDGSTPTAQRNLYISLLAEILSRPRRSGEETQSK